MGDLSSRVHKTHSMSPWRWALVTVGFRVRLGSFHYCKNCGGEHAKCKGVEDMQMVLYAPCKAAPEPVWLKEIDLGDYDD